VVLGLGLAKLDNKIFRIGHMGDIRMPEILAIIGCIELALKETGAPVNFGEGLKAVQASFLNS